MSKNDVQINSVTMPSELKEKIRSIAQSEEERLGYTVKLGDIVRRALIEFCKNYEKVPATQKWKDEHVKKFQS